VARFEQKFRQFPCFIKGEAIDRVHLPPRRVSGEARVTNEGDVLIRVGQSELRTDLAPGPRANATRWFFGGTVTRRCSIGRGAVDERSGPFSSPSPYRFDCQAGASARYSGTTVVTAQMTATRAGVAPLVGELAGGMLIVQGDAVSQVASCTCSIGPSLVASLRRKCNEQPQNGGCLAESFRQSKRIRKSQTEYRSRCIWSGCMPGSRLGTRSVRSV